MTEKECCKPTQEELDMLAQGDYNCYELWGDTSPSCPKCFKHTYGENNG